MMYFPMLFQHVYLSDVLAFLGPSWDRLGSQLPPHENYEKQLVFDCFSEGEVGSQDDPKMGPRSQDISLSKNVQKPL